MKNSKSFFAILFLINLFSFHTSAQPGTLDITFDGDGKVITAAGPANDQILSMALQPDGKIVVAGLTSAANYYPFASARYNTDGSLDTSYGGDGIAQTFVSLPAAATSIAIAIQQDGKIVLGGDSGFAVDHDFMLVRYNTDGEPDSSFGGDGIVITPISAGEDRINAIAIQNDGKIVAGGYSLNIPDQDIVLTRYNTDGSLDTSFSNDGVLTMNVSNFDTDIYSLAIQPDGKILASSLLDGTGSDDWLILRLLSDGTPDSTFNGTGITSIDFNGRDDYGMSLVLQPDDKIIISGLSILATGTDRDGALARVNPDGSLDTTFSIDGKLTTDFSSGNNDMLYSVALQPDGKIVVSGAMGTNSDVDFLVARYLANGSLDSGFCAGGFLQVAFGTGYDEAWSILLQPDGKVVAAGYTESATDYDFALIRFIPGVSQGISDFNSSDNLISVFPNPLNENFTIEFLIKQPGNVSVHLLDMQGRVLKTFFESQHAAVGKNVYPLKLPQNLASGAYLISLETEQGKMVRKIIK